MKLFLAILIFTFQIFSQTAGLKGRITSNNSPVPSVNIFLLNTSIGSISDSRGNYVLKNLPLGIYEVRFSSIGYETQIVELNFQQNRTIELNINLKETAFELEEIDVLGFTTRKQKDPQVSIIEVNPRNAKVLPGASEDVLRTLQALPGVLAPNDFSSQLIIRGSTPDQNLIIMDDVEIYNPYRLYGVVSMFNPDVVNNINLITGGFPSKYGDRLSAVLDITNREGTIDNSFIGSLNTSIVNANVVLEGKNPFNIKGSWIFNSRRTYYDLIVEPFVKSAGLVEDDVSFPNFYDLQGKLMFGPFNGHKFIINGILSRDGVNVVSGSERTTPDSVSVNNLTKNDVASFAWHFTPTKKTFNKLTASWYRNGGAADFDSKILDPTLNRDDFENTIPDTLSNYLLGFSSNAEFSFVKFSVDNNLLHLWGDNEFEAGIGFDLVRTLIDFKFQLDPELQAIFSANPNFRNSLSDIRDVNDQYKYRAFVQNNFKIAENFYFQPGLRFDFFDILKKYYLSPRISLSYGINKLTTLRFVWGDFYQSPGYEKLRDQNVLFDLNRNFTNNLEAEKSTHYVFGIERWITNEWNFRVEGYYKDFNNLIIPVVNQGSVFYTEQIPGRDKSKTNGWTRPVVVKGDSLTQIPFNGAEGEAYGIELLLAKQNRTVNTKFDGWISYSFAFADRIQREKISPFRFDQRHTINFVLNYRFNESFELGTRWQYGSGFPYTEPVGIKPRIVYRDLNGDLIPETPVIATRPVINNGETVNEVIFDIDYGDNTFNKRKPAYHRLDIRFSYFTDIWGKDWIFYLDVINIYNRKNVVGYNYYIEKDLTLGRRANNMFPILPTFGFSVKF